MATGTPRVIQLTANYSASVSYTGTATATFTLPDGCTYIGAGVYSMTLSGNTAGGSRGTYTIGCSGKTINLSVMIGGNWGSTTITGTIVLNVFVI